MDITIKQPKTVTVTTLFMEVPADDDDVEQECIDADCPGRVNGILRMTINMDTGRIADWPAGRTATIHLKPRDSGSYRLTDGVDTIASDQNYVPPFFPGDHYGDYVIFEINGDGVITNWAPSADLVEEWVSGLDSDD